MRDTARGKRGRTRTGNTYDAVLIMRVTEVFREQFARVASQQGYSLSEGVRQAMQEWMDRSNVGGTDPGAP